MSRLSIFDAAMLTILTSRLREYKDTVSLFIFTLDLVTRNCPVLTAVENLPYDCLKLVPCSPELGGVVVLSSNSIIHIAQNSRRIVLPVAGDKPRGGVRRCELRLRHVERVDGDELRAQLREGEMITVVREDPVQEREGRSGEGQHLAQPVAISRVARVRGVGQHG